MKLLSDEFCLAEEMINHDEIDVDAGDRYFISLRPSKIPECMKDSFCGELISEVYIFAYSDLSNLELLSCDVFGQTFVEAWTPTAKEVEIIKMSRKTPCFSYGDIRRK